MANPDIHRYCNRCNQPMRNDGTEDSPKWVCDNPSCRKYKPPTKKGKK